MKRLVKLLLMTTIGLLAACSSSRPDAADVTANDRALSLIEQKNYGEAIQLLNIELENNPENSETRVLLASALAGQHGVTIARFTNLASILVQKSKARSETGDKYKDLEAQAEFARSAFEGIPPLNNRFAYEDLTKALVVLIESQDSPGIHIFRALLRLVIFKYEITHPYKINFSRSCTVDIQPLQLWFFSLTLNLQSLVSDLLAGIKDEETRLDLEKLYQKIVKARVSIEESFADLNEKNEAQVTQIVKKFYSKCE